MDNLRVKREMASMVLISPKTGKLNFMRSTNNSTRWGQAAGHRNSDDDERNPHQPHPPSRPDAMAHPKNNLRDQGEFDVGRDSRSLANLGITNRRYKPITKAKMTARTMAGR